MNKKQRNKNAELETFLKIIRRNSDLMHLFIALEPSGHYCGHCSFNGDQVLNSFFPYKTKERGIE